MKLLIAGAGGQVGRELVLRGRERGHAIEARTRGDLDIRDAAAVTAAAAGADLIINAAAYTAVDRAEEDEAGATAVNRDGAENLARAGPPILHISTDYVFDGRQPSPWRESDPVRPLGVYGRSKLAGERAVAAANPHHLILRTAWVFGPHGGNFVTTMLRLGRERDSLSVVDDQTGGPTPASAIADALLTMAEACRRSGFADWGVYHFCGRPSLTWRTFAEAIFAAAGLQVRVAPTTTAAYGAPAPRPANSVLDCGKIARVFSIAQPDWEPALRAVIDAEAAAGD